MERIEGKMNKARRASRSGVRLRSGTRVASKRVWTLLAAILFALALFSTSALALFKGSKSVFSGSAGKHAGGAGSAFINSKGKGVAAKGKDLVNMILGEAALSAGFGAYLCGQDKCAGYNFANDEYDFRISPMSDEDRSTRAREIYDQYLGPNAEQPLADLEPPLAPKVLKEIAASFKGGKLLHKDVFKPVIRAFKETWLQVEAGNWKKTPEGAAMLKTMSEQIIKTYAMFYKDDEGEVKKLCLAKLAATKKGAEGFLSISEKAAGAKDVVDVPDLLFVLGNPVLKQSFTKHLGTEVSPENILFLNAERAYRLAFDSWTTIDSGNEDRARELFTKHMDPATPRPGDPENPNVPTAEVNLPGKILTQVRDAINDPDFVATRDLFVEARENIRLLAGKDSMRRWVALPTTKKLFAEQAALLRPQMDSLFDNKGGAKVMECIATRTQVVIKTEKSEKAGGVVAPVKKKNSGPKPRRIRA